MAAGRSCLLMLALLVGFTFAEAHLLAPLASAARWPLAVVLAVFASLFAGSLISVAVAPAEVALIRGFLRGDTPEHGSPAAVCGRIEGVVDPPPSPVGQEPSVAWEVEVFAMVYDPTLKRSRKVLTLKGAGREAFVCDSGSARVRVGGLLDLGAVSPTSWEGADVWPALQVLAADPVAQPFEQTGKGVSDSLEDFATHEEHYRRLRFDPAARLRQEHRVEERVLRPGQEVCLLGTWDRHGSLGGLDILGVSRVRVFPGSPRRVIARFRAKVWLGLLAMTLLLLASHGAVYGLLLTGEESAFTGERS